MFAASVKTGGMSLASVAHVNYSNPDLSHEHFEFAARWRARGRARACVRLHV